ncbi:MAG: hypothetical protein ACXWXZ_22020, partial [Candidatus Binatia bacterium]
EQTWIPACAGMTRQADRLWRESHSFLLSVGVRKIMIHFVVKNSFPFGCIVAALGYLCFCGDAFRSFEVNGYVEE